MPRPRTIVSTPLGGLIDSESEPDLDAFDETEIQIARSTGTAKKPRGRSVSTTRVTKPASRTVRRTSEGAVTATTTASKQNVKPGTRAGAGRGALKSQQPEHNETTQTGNGNTLSEIKKTRGRPPRSAPGSASKPIVGDSSILVPASTVKRRGRPPKQLPVLPEEIPETQLEDPMQLDVVSEEQEREEKEVTPVINFLDVIYEHDLSDVALRRRFGELKTKYDNLEMRHQELRDVGVKEAERNYERLRKQAEERTIAANKLIAELKAELATQTLLARQGEQLRKQLEASESRANSLQEIIEDTNASLSESKKEIKTLSTKLAAIRSSETNTGNASKANAAVNATAQAKEDLYADLTGLIVRGMKEDVEEDVFDCIQTGRNGTLHFKLAIERAEGMDNYDEVGFTYRPQLDPSRDQDLMDILPDFLIEEITFSRPQASRFYARVIKSMTEAPQSA